MGGRGRGRGRGGRAGLSFNVEALGIAKGDALPEPVLQPPPIYPPLEFHPAPMDYTNTEQLRYREELINHWAKTREALAPPPPKTLVDYKSDSNELEQAPKHNFQFQWYKFPSELRPSTRKRKNSQSTSKSKVAKKKSNITNIEDLLAQLEKSEHMEIKTEVEDEEEDKQENKEEHGEDEEREYEDDEDIDEEMDEGTDYNQNYFDNGESYLDEDDDLDDGPIY